MICNDAELSGLDTELSVVLGYVQAQTGGDQSSFMKEQQEWIQRKNQRCKTDLYGHCVSKGSAFSSLRAWVQPG